MEQELNTSWLLNKYSLGEKEIKHTETSVYVNGNDGYKRHVNTQQALSKREAIVALSLCHYRTPPKEVAKLLGVVFKNHSSKEGHWLYIAQRWNPRAITRVIEMMTKQHRRGDVTIKNPAAYFTFLIKMRKKRRTSTGTNDTRKQQNKDSAKDL